MCSVQIFKFLAKIYIINLIFSQEYIFIAFSQESAFSFSQVSNTHLAKIYTTRIRVPTQKPCIWFGLDILLSLLYFVPNLNVREGRAGEQTGLMNPSAIANLPPLKKKKKKEYSSSRKMVLHN